MLCRFFDRLKQEVCNRFSWTNDNLDCTSTLIREGGEISLYKTRFGDFFWLNKAKYVDKSIIDTGLFEPHSTEVVRKLVKSGDVVMDVGANIGYYSVILSKLVGEGGKVYCFEPTDHYSYVLQSNIEANNTKNVELIKLGLSNIRQTLDIQVGANSATLHSPGKVPLNFTERIELVSLDEWVVNHNIEKINFIKVDIDGHEPCFLNGAWNTLEKYDPVILLEVSHPHYLDAGFTAWDFYDLLKSRGYRIYHEVNLAEIVTKEDFLIKCGNFAYSANIVISKNDIVTGDPVGGQR